MKKETKDTLLGGLFILILIGIFLPNDEAPVKEENVDKPAQIKEQVVKAKQNTLKGGYGACVSEELFDQFVTFGVQKDMKGTEYLLKNGCFITKEGIEFSLIDRSFTGTSKIRVYINNDAIILWTNNENLNL
jgi:hypothetical protein